MVFQLEMVSTARTGGQKRDVLPAKNHEEFRRITRVPNLCSPVFYFCRHLLRVIRTSIQVERPEGGPEVDHILRLTCNSAFRLEFEETLPKFFEGFEFGSFQNRVTSFDMRF